MSSTDSDSGHAIAVNPEGAPSEERGRARRQASRLVPHLTVAERVARGRAARAEVPRSSHAGFEPAAHRADPIALLEQQAETRVPELVPIRYGRMLVSPFTFYRGAALIMASDLSATPSSGLRVQACGDAHLSNFGVFGSVERRLMFDVNDFDETLPGPWEWDVKRLAASLVVAARGNGYSRKERSKIVRDTVGRYRDAMRSFATMPNLAVWYSRLDVEELLGQLRGQVNAKMLKRAEQGLAKARTRDSLQAFSKLTHLVDGEPRIISDPPLIVPVEELFPEATADQVTDRVHEFVRGYRQSLQTDRRILLEQYRFVHMAHKVVGVGSVGTRAWIALFLGLDGQDPLFVQVKEAQASVLEEYVGKSGYANHGERVVAGQHLMQASSDIFLGWKRMTGVDNIERDFYARQLKDWKGSAEVEVMIPEGMTLYGQMCGWTLARAHARSGDRVAIATYLGSNDTFDRALAEFAEAYADENERDYQALVDAVKSGRITAQTGL
jgi:uncharacterized protein (DUF2252 family)